MSHSCLGTISRPPPVSPSMRDSFSAQPGSQDLVTASIPIGFFLKGPLKYQQSVRGILLKVHEAPSTCSANGGPHELGGEAVARPECARALADGSASAFCSTCQAALMEEAPTLLPTLKPLAWYLWGFGSLGNFGIMLAFISSAAAQIPQPRVRRRRHRQGPRLRRHFSSIRPWQLLAGFDKELVCLPRSRCFQRGAIRTCHSTGRPWASLC